MYTITTSQMNAIDKNCEYFGLSTLQLMENAGAGIAKEVKNLIKSGTIVVIAGRGNNGGDAFVAARHLAQYSNYKVKIILLGRIDQIKTEDAIKNYQILKHSAITDIFEVSDSTQILNLDWIDNADLIIDAILGTGVKSKIREPESTAIDIINNSKAKVVSVDVPSGFDPDGGDCEKSVSSDVTLTFHRIKPGLESKDINRYAKSVKVVDIGVCSDAEKIVGRGNLEVLKKRSESSHKGNSGRILVIGGGAYSGAPGLTSLAALRTGADLVTIATPKNVADIIASFSPNLIVDSLSNEVLCSEDIPKIKDLVKSHDVVIIGMGIGRDDRSKSAIEKIIPYCQKVVVDADGLYGVDYNSISESGCEVIITPHAGEFSYLQNKNTPKDRDSRACDVMDFSKNNHLITILKGKEDIISDGKRILYNQTGNPGMTVGGTGDVLAGITGALFAVNSAIDAASCGAFINGASGDLAFEEKGYGLLATDIIDRITDVINIGK
ncbi:NAD(P)H-hydrate dehydratase [Methanohalobium sp.]|uniref:NAD(P)H-hydrate dehydratase n=1 Tax=Methanohalobium sp. TaxID=2837493 RepID=UPI0025EA681F|nr:NAD(P)H-hydrate dehydratase [Methanohalobium sp.]